MSATVIDSLIVTLGLDPSGFKKGQREADKSLKATTKSVTTAADDMGKAIKGVAKEFALAFLGFESAAGLVKMLTDLNASTAALGRLAANTGIAANQLKNYQNAFELAGGTAEDFNDTIDKIQSNQTKLATTGKSDWLGFLRQLKVDLLDINGKPRDALQVVTDLSARLSKLPRAEGFQIGKQFGFSPGALNALLQGPDAIAKLVEQEKQLHQITEQDTDAAQQLTQAWTLMKQQGSALGQSLLTEISPAIQVVFDGIQSLIQGFKGASDGSSKFGKYVAFLKDTFGLLINLVRLAAAGIVALGEKLMNSAVGKFFQKIFGGAFTVISEAVRSARNATDDQVQAAEDVAYGGSDPTAAGRAVNQSVAGAATAAAPPGSAQAPGARPASGTRGVRNNNPGNIKYGPLAIKYGAVGRDKDGFAIFPSQAVGIAAARAAVVRILGGGKTLTQLLNTYAPPSDHNDTPAYIAAVSKSTGIGANDTITNPSPALLAAIFAHESGAGAVSTGALNAALGASNGAGLAARGAGARAGVIDRNGGGSNTSVEIGSMTVTTQATDANAMAAGAAAALQRKLNTAQADSGVRS